MVQWVRICLPTQGTQVQSLVWEDPTCCGATKPMRRSYGAHVRWSPGSTREATVVRSTSTTRERVPLTATRESPRVAAKTQHSQKSINVF